MDPSNGHIKTAKKVSVIIDPKIKDPVASHAPDYSVITVRVGLTDQVDNILAIAPPNQATVVEFNVESSVGLTEENRPDLFVSAFLAHTKGHASNDQPTIQELIFDNFNQAEILKILDFLNERPNNDPWLNHMKIVRIIGIDPSQFAERQSIKEKFADMLVAHNPLMAMLCWSEHSNVQ